MRKKYDHPATLSVNLAFDSKLLDVLYDERKKPINRKVPSTSNKQFRTKSRNSQSLVKSKTI